MVPNGKARLSRLASVYLADYLSSPVVYAPTLRCIIKRLILLPALFEDEAYVHVCEQ